MLVANNTLPSISPQLNSFVRPSDPIDPTLTAQRNGTQGTITSTIVRTLTYSDDKAKASYSGENIANVVINSTTYYLSNNPDPPVGFYYLNQETLEIEINTGYDTSGLTVLFEVITTTVKLSKIENIPLTFRTYLVIGEFNFSRSFRGHPSGSFRIGCRATQYNSIRTALKPGTPLNLKGVDYRVRSLSRDIVEDRQGYDFVRVSLQGYWEKQGDTYRSPLDEPIREADLIEDQCGFEYNYRDALLKVGVSLKGGNIVKKVGRNISSTQTTTARQLLEDQQRLLVEGLYVDWSSRAGVELRRWDSPNIFRVDHLVADLSQPNQFASITISENGYGALVSGCYLAHELNNAELQLDQDPNGNQDGDEYVCLTEGDRNPQEPPLELRGAVFYSFNYDKLRSPSFCFDNSEPSKEITRCQLNGTDLEVTEKHYGFKYTSSDIFDFRVDNDENISYVPKSLVDILLNVEWTQTKLIQWQYTYDSVTGYFLKAIGSGWELTRDLRETDDKEAIQLAAAISLETDEEAIANLTRQLQGYTRFYKRSLSPSELFELDDLSNYYEDLRKQDEEEDNYIPPLYPMVSEREENSLLIRPDPRSTSEDPQPDLIIGSQSKESQKIIINSTAPEKFLGFTEVENQENTNLTDTASSQTFEENSGRPGLQPRLNQQVGCYRRKKEDSSNQPKYSISTPGVNTFSITTTTLSYPGAYTIQQAIDAATLDYQIKNSQDSCTLELPLGESLTGLEMGDVVIYKGDRYRVFGYNENGRIQVDRGNYSNIQLTLGKDVDLSLTRKII